MRRIEFLILVIILVVAFILRLYKIDSPLADWHSWRQADTSSVSRNFLKYGFDFLHPRFDDLSNIPSGRENPEGYRMVEFPIYNLLQAAAARTFPQKSLEWWGRMVSLLVSLASLVTLYLIVRQYSNARIATLSAFFFAVLPFNIYYSRVVLPEPMAVLMMLLTIYFFGKWLNAVKHSWIYYSLSFIAAALALLLKPFTIFFFFPLFWLAWRKWQFGLFKKPSLYLFVFLTILPFILWRIWIAQYPEGIPNYIWLLNEANIRFKGAFFRWIFGERIGKLILGFYGLPIFVLGILSPQEKKENWFFHFWLVGMLFYFSVVASGNVHHDYYQILVIPTICIFLAKGANLLLFSSFFNKTLSWMMLLVSCFFMLAFSWYGVRGFFNINHPEIVKAGMMADLLIPKSAKVIAPYNGDTAFLYQINRPGWPIINDEISADYLISRGATHYVSVNFDPQTQRLMEAYKILKQTDNFVILDLTSPK